MEVRRTNGDDQRVVASDMDFRLRADHNSAASFCYLAGVGITVSVHANSFHKILSALQVLANDILNTEAAT